MNGVGIFHTCTIKLAQSWVYDVHSLHLTRNQELKERPNKRDALDGVNLHSNASKYEVRSTRSLQSTGSGRVRNTYVHKEYHLSLHNSFRLKTAVNRDVSVADRFICDRHTTTN